MERLFSLCAVLVLSMLAGCASIETASYCNDNARQAIVRDNDRLVAQKKVIEAYEARKQVPGMVYSSLSNEEMMDEYKRDYNKAVGLLEYQSEKFNKLCTNMVAVK